MRTIVVTGASRGIGRAVAERFAGDHVVALVRPGTDPAALAHAARLTTIPIALDDLAALDALAAHPDLPTRVDLLVHVAGVSDRGRVAEVSGADWQRQLLINLVAPLALTRALLPALRDAHGTVVFVNSIVGLKGAGAGGGVYAASKTALRAAADVLRTEEPGIRVASLYPGRVATDMQRELRAYEQEPYTEEDYLSADDVADAVVTITATSPTVELSDVTIMPRGR